MVDVAAAGANNFVDVTSSPFTPQQSGDHTFQIQVDNNNNVQESNEGNNRLTKSLHVYQYVYDASIHFTDFRSKKNMDKGDKDEYHISGRVDITGL